VKKFISGIFKLLVILNILSFVFSHQFSNLFLTANAAVNGMKLLERDGGNVRCVHRTPRELGFGAEQSQFFKALAIIMLPAVPGSILGNIIFENPKKTTC